MMRGYVLEVPKAYSSIVLLPNPAPGFHASDRCQDGTGHDVCQQGFKMGGKLHHLKRVSGEPQEGILLGYV